MVAALVVLLGQAVYFFLQPRQAVLYRLVCILFSLVFAGLVALWWSRQSTVEEPEESILQLDEEEAFGGLDLASGLLRGFILSVVVFGLTAFIGWGGSMIGFEDFLSGLIYDRDFKQLIYDIELLERVESYQAAIDLADQWLAKPLSREKQVILAKMKVKDLLALGDKAATWEEQVHYFSLAKETAERWKLDPSLVALADAEERAVQPTQTPLPAPTPLPTPTPWPTPTDRPTWTPAPTPTERPTYTPQPPPPTWTPFPTPPPTVTSMPPTATLEPTPSPRPPWSDCTGATVDNRIGAAGNFWAWNCGKWGWFGQWQPSAELNPVGGVLPQKYVSGARGFYLCPPNGAHPRPYTAVTCD